MSSWKVSAEQIEIFDHYSADKLEIGKLGSYQVVVPKDKYKNGETVVFIPEKSIIPKEISEGEEFASYLTGGEKNRVKTVTLRGEMSCGVILPITEKVLSRVSNLEIGEDISLLLGIRMYIPPIPSCLSGQVKPITSAKYGRHDCEQFSIYANEFTDGERIVVTEKIHGSQCIYFKSFDTDEEFVTSKGQLGRGLSIEEDDNNSYWKAIRNEDIQNIVCTNWTSGSVQIFSEVVPVQKGYSYGFTNPTIRIFDIRYNGQCLPYDQVPSEFKPIWVPIIYDGPIDKSTVRDFATGNETISGKQIHIKEGVVIAPYIDRTARDRTRLRLKIINQKYKESGEEFN